MKATRWLRLHQSTKSALRTNRRGLRPLRKRLSTSRLVGRQYKIDLRREQKALAKIIERRGARKGAHK